MHTEWPLPQGLNGEILVTAKTDPGWVPLYPLCSGLVIERGRYIVHVHTIKLIVQKDLIDIN